MLTIASHHSDQIRDGVCRRNFLKLGGTRTGGLALALVAALLTPAPLPAADWPQFMRTGERSGDAADETLKLPLGLTTCVRLQDAVTTSPAVVAGKVYVADQMGTAYCIDPAANRVVWKAAPDG